MCRIKHIKHHKPFAILPIYRLQGSSFLLAHSCFCKKKLKRFPNQIDETRLNGFNKLLCNGMRVRNSKHTSYLQKIYKTQFIYIACIYSLPILFISRWVYEIDKFIPKSWSIQIMRSQKQQIRKCRQFFNHQRYYVDLFVIFLE